jgi:hypothetical protein
MIGYLPAINYIKKYAHDMAYLAIPREDEPENKFANACTQPWS